MLPARHELKGKHTTTHAVKAAKYFVMLEANECWKPPLATTIMTSKISIINGMRMNAMGDTSRRRPVIRKMYMASIVTPIGVDASGWRPLATGRIPEAGASTARGRVATLLIGTHQKQSGWQKA